MYLHINVVLPQNFTKGCKWLNTLSADCIGAGSMNVFTLTSVGGGGVDIDKRVE